MACQSKPEAGRGNANVKFLSLVLLNPNSDTNYVHDINDAARLSIHLSVTLHYGHDTKRKQEFRIIARDYVITNAKPTAKCNTFLP
jgi:hypothetical protein